MIRINEDLCVGCGLCVKDCVTLYLSIKEPEHKAHITGDRCLSCGHCEAICPREAISVEGGGYEAYPDFDLEDAYVEPRELSAFMANRRSVRMFKQVPVESEKIEMIINAGRFSPTGCNYQHTGYIVINERMKEIKTKAALALEGKTLDIMSQNINRTTLERIHDAAENGGDRLFFGAPLVIALTDLKGSSGVDIGIAAGRMELMANALGLGVCFNGIFPQIAYNVEEVSDLIGLSDDRQIFASLVIGYPTVSYMRPAKRKKANVKSL